MHVHVQPPAPAYGPASIMVSETSTTMDPTEESKIILLFRLLHDNYCLLIFIMHVDAQGTGVHKELQGDSLLGQPPP